MPVDAITSFLIILAVALTTFATRVFPFLVFPRGKEIPDVVKYLGRVLTPAVSWSSIASTTPPAVIGMLVVYCLRSTKILAAPYGLPEAAAVIVTAALHVWKRNNLLSIGVGTVLYMFLIQCFS